MKKIFNPDGIGVDFLFNKCDNIIMRDVILTILKYLVYLVVLVVFSIYVIKLKPAVIPDDISERLNHYVDNFLSFFNIKRLPFLKQEPAPEVTIKVGEKLIAKPAVKRLFPNRIIDFLIYNNYYSMISEVSLSTINKINNEIVRYNNQLQTMAALPIFKTAVLSKRFDERPIAVTDYIMRLKKLSPDIKEITIFDEKLAPLEDYKLSLKILAEDKVLFTEKEIILLHPFFDSARELIGGIALILNASVVTKYLQPLLKDQNFALVNLAGDVVISSYDFPELSAAIKEGKDKIASFQLRYFPAEFFTLVSINKPYPVILSIINIGRVLIFAVLVGIIIYLAIIAIKQISQISKKKTMVPDIGTVMHKITDTTNKVLQTSVSVSEQLKQIPEIIKSTVESMPVKIVEKKSEQRPIIKIPAIIKSVVASPSLKAAEEKLEFKRTIETTPVKTAEKKSEHRPTVKIPEIFKSPVIEPLSAKPIQKKRELKPIIKLFEKPKKVWKLSK